MVEVMMTYLMEMSTNTSMMTELTAKAVQVVARLYIAVLVAL